MLAVNGLAGQKGCYQLWCMRDGPNNGAHDLQKMLSLEHWAYLDIEMSKLRRPKGGNIYCRIITVLDTTMDGNVLWAAIPSDRSSDVAAFHVTTAMVAAPDARIDCASSVRSGGSKTAPDRLVIRPWLIEDEYGVGAEVPIANYLLHEIGHTCGLPGNCPPAPNVMREPSDPTHCTALYNDSNGLTPWGPAGADDTTANYEAMRRHCKIR